MNELMIDWKSYLFQLFQWNPDLIYAYLSHSFGYGISKDRNNMHMIMAIDVRRSSSEQLYESIYLCCKLLHNMTFFE